MWPGVRGTGGPRSAVTGVANAMAVGRSRSTVNACNERASAKRRNNNNNNNNNRDAYHIRFPVCAPRTYTPLARRNCNADTLCVHCTRRVYCVQRFARVAQRRPSLSSSTWRLSRRGWLAYAHAPDRIRANERHRGGGDDSYCRGPSTPPPINPTLVAAPWTRDPPYYYKRLIIILL